MADDCGVLYSKDGRKVFLAPITSNEYMIKSGVIAIANYAFNWHYNQYNGVLYTNKYTHEKNITKLLIPDTVIAIGSEAFSDNTAINEIIVSHKLEYIGQRAFSGCRYMMDFDLPSTVKYIETEALMDAGMRLKNYLYQLQLGISGAMPLEVALL